MNVPPGRRGTGAAVIHPSRNLRRGACGYCLVSGEVEDVMCSGGDHLHCSTCAGSDLALRGTWRQGIAPFRLAVDRLDAGGSSWL